MAHGFSVPLAYRLPGASKAAMMPRGTVSAKGSSFQSADGSRAGGCLFPYPSQSANYTRTESWRTMSTTKMDMPRRLM